MALAPPVPIHAMNGGPSTQALLFGLLTALLVGLALALGLAFGLAALLRLLAGARARGVYLGVALALALLGVLSWMENPFSARLAPTQRFLGGFLLLVMAAVMGVYLWARRAPDLRRRP